MNKDKMIEVIASVAGIPTRKAEAAFQALLTELPDWHTLHKNNRSKSIMNTIAAIGVSYQELLNMRDNT